MTLRRLLVVLAIFLPAPAFAVCSDPAGAAAARAAVAAACPCDAFVNHGAYVLCARASVSAANLSPSCAAEVRRCAARSTCGRPTSTACCRTRRGITRCRIARSTERCLALGGQPTQCPSCCDACTSGGCATTTTVTSTSTTVTPTTTSTTTIACAADHCGDGVRQPECAESCDGSDDICGVPLGGVIFPRTCGEPGTTDECRCCAASGYFCGALRRQLFSCCGGLECLNFGPSPATLYGYWYCVSDCSAQEDCAAGTACVCGHCFPTSGTCTDDAGCGGSGLCLNGGCLGPLYPCEECAGLFDVYDCVSGFCVPRVCFPY